MPLYLYLDRRTFLHRLHPGAKLVGMLSLFVAALVCERPLLLLPLSAGAAALLVWSESLPNVRRLRVLFGAVFIMTFVIWSVFYGRGELLLALGPLAISTEGVRYALGMALRLTTFLAVGTLFLSTAKVEEFAYALARLGLPYKLGFTMTLAFRLVPAFVDAAFAVVQAQRCRGFDFDRGNLWDRLRRYVPVIVPVFIGALRRADHMAMALEARGFQLRTPRTFYQRYRFAARDAVAIAIVIGIAALYVWLWSAGYTRVAAA